MKTVYLPSLNTKKEKNTVKVTNAKLVGVEGRAYNQGVVAKPVDSGEGCTIEIPAELFGYNEFESLLIFLTLPYHPFRSKKHFEVSCEFEI